MTLFVKLRTSYHQDPKVLDLDDERAELLYVRSLTYCKQHLTDGFVHRRALPTFAPFIDEVLPRDLAAELVRVGLWEVVEDGWNVTSWLNHNKPRDEIMTRNKGAELAHIRHHVRKGVISPDCPYCIDAGDETPSSERTSASRNASTHCVDAMPESESETESSSARTYGTTPPESSPTVPAAEAAGEEEEGNPRPLTATEQTALVEAAIEHMAKCDHHHATLDGTHIRNPDAYRRRCAETRRQTHHDALTSLATRATTATDPIDLAEHLDPACGPLDGGTERAARRYAQDQARIAAEDAEHAEAVARREAAEAWLDQLDPTRRSELETEAEATATRIGDRTPPYFVRQQLIALALDAMTADQRATA